MLSFSTLFERPNTIHSRVFGGYPKVIAEYEIVIVAYSANKLIDTAARTAEQRIRDVEEASHTLPRQAFSEKLLFAFGFPRNKLTP